VTEIGSPTLTRRGRVPRILLDRRHHAAAQTDLQRRRSLRAPQCERYWLLHEPQETESICLDVLAAQGDNQEALVMLILATTDQFGSGSVKGPGDARDLLLKLRDEYERRYYGGIICERWMKAQLRDGAHPSLATGWFLEALDDYGVAHALSPPGNHDAVLRWNACVRYLERHPDLAAELERRDSEDFSDDRPA
jgi:hypothetical protein